MVEATLNADYNSYIDARFRNTARSGLNLEMANQLTGVFKDSVTAEATKAAQALEQKMVQDAYREFSKQKWEKAAQEYKDISKQGATFAEISAAYKNVSKTQVAYIDSGMMKFNEIPKSFIDTLNSSKKEISKTVTTATTSSKDTVKDALAEQQAISASANAKNDLVKKNYQEAYTKVQNLDKDWQSGKCVTQMYCKRL